MCSPDSDMAMPTEHGQHRTPNAGGRRSLRSGADGLDVPVADGLDIYDDGARIMHVDDIAFPAVGRAEIDVDCRGDGAAVAIGRDGDERPRGVRRRFRLPD